MADENSWLEALEDKLVERRLEVEDVEGTLNVKAGKGVIAAKANIDPKPLWAVLSDTAPEGRERLIAGYASGVKHVLMEPRRSDASEWDYVKTAGRLLPNIEVHTFVLGAEAAAGESPWTMDFHEDLVLAYFVDLDMGMRVLTQSQVEGWSATENRVTSAARSLLFHKSRSLKTSKLDDFEGVEKIHTGDGYDAMRCIVVADLFFGDFDDSYRFSMPTQDALLFTRGDDEALVDALRTATDAHYAKADYPLTRSIYAFETGRPVLAEPRAKQ
ncbi:hypothetical protein FIV42_28885 [Persicimonas caeni]|uniref:Uncharacterized protein n=1 Tax=Persicimonas caeni TaxID=2292766 RepID=A0A4Y6Q226_PERCE|nr:hypothetical protein [Persicimonas caeni]QDG54616.1 hypothetical protein FIV42_28885 [Persicimonas caeni]QED35837.1 hypothetical protein FRD00_28880 [Persicimonas caeni]